MVKNITGTLIWYYYICKREVWLMSREINSYQDNAFLELGRIISGESYSREKKEIPIEGGKIDLIKKRDGSLVIGEIKKSSKYLEPATMQLLFYLWKLKRLGVEATGELLIPKEKKRIPVNLTPDAIEKLENAIQNIKEIIKRDTPPPVVKTRFCRRCAYYEFCNA